MLVDPVGEGIAIGEALATAEAAHDEAATATQEANAAAVAGLVIASEVANQDERLDRLEAAFSLLVEALTVQEEVISEVAEDAQEAQEAAEEALEVATVAEEVSETDADVVAEVVAEEGLRGDQEDAGGSESVPDESTGGEQADEASPRADVGGRTSRSRFRRGGRR